MVGVRMAAVRDAFWETWERLKVIDVFSFRCVITRLWEYYKQGHGRPSSTIRHDLHTDATTLYNIALWFSFLTPGTTCIFSFRCVITLLWEYYKQGHGRPSSIIRPDLHTDATTLYNIALWFPFLTPGTTCIFSFRGVITRLWEYYKQGHGHPSSTIRPDLHTDATTLYNIASWFPFLTPGTTCISLIIIYFRHWEAEVQLAFVALIIPVILPGYISSSTSLVFINSRFRTFHC